MGGEFGGMGSPAGLCGDGVVGGGGVLQLCECAAACVFRAGHVSIAADRGGGAVDGSGVGDVHRGGVSTDAVAAWAASGLGAAEAEGCFGIGSSAGAGA